MCRKFKQTKFTENVFLYMNVKISNFSIHSIIWNTNNPTMKFTSVGSLKFEMENTKSTKTKTTMVMMMKKL